MVNILVKNLIIIAYVRMNMIIAGLYGPQKDFPLTSGDIPWLCWFL